MIDFAVFIAAGATVTKAVDYLRGQLDPKDKAPKWTWIVAAFAFGIAISFLQEINLFTYATNHAPPHWVAHVGTGMGIGANASGFHEVFDFFSSKAKASRLTARAAAKEAGLKAGHEH